MNYKTNDPTNEKHTSSKTSPSPPQEDSEENFKPELQYPGDEFRVKVVRARTWERTVMMVTGTKPGG